MAVAKYITGKITDSAGNPRSGFRVLATLSQACTIPGTQEVIPISVGTVTGADGTWTLQQYATNDLTPGNTFVSIFEDGSTVPLTIQVPQGTDSGGHVGSLADPFHVSLLTTSTPTASPTPNNVTSLNVSGPATFSGSMIEGKDFQRSSQTVTEAVLVSGIDATAGEMVSVTLTANRVVGLPLNPVTGQELQLRVTQGGTGNYTLTWPAGIKTKWQPAPAVGAISTLTLRYYATAWQQVAGQVAVSDAGVLVHQGPAVVQSLTVSNSPYTPTALAIAGSAAGAGVINDILYFPFPSGGDDTTLLNTIIAVANAREFVFQPNSTYSISAPLTPTANGQRFYIPVSTTIVQATWGLPWFEVRSLTDVEIDCRGFLTSTQPRTQIVTAPYDGTGARIRCAGVYGYQCDRLRIPFIRVNNAVTGVTLRGNTDNVTLTNDVHIGKILVSNVDWGLLYGQQKGMQVETIKGAVAFSQDFPHLIYSTSVTAAGKSQDCTIGEAVCTGTGIVNTTSAGAVAPATPATITPVSMTNIVPAMTLHLDLDAAHGTSEDIVVIAVNTGAGTFTANVVNAHTGGVRLVADHHAYSIKDQVGLAAGKWVADGCGGLLTCDDMTDSTFEALIGINLTALTGAATIQGQASIGNCDRNRVGLALITQANSGIREPAVSWGINANNSDNTIDDLQAHVYYTVGAIWAVNISGTRNALKHVKIVSLGTSAPRGVLLNLGDGHRLSDLQTVGCQYGFGIGNATNCHVDITPEDQDTTSLVAPGTIQGTGVGAIIKTRNTRFTQAFSGGGRTPDLTVGDYITYTVSSNAAWTINNPINPTDGAELTIELANTSGGAIATPGYGAAFAHAGAVAPTPPGTLKSRVTSYKYNATKALWIETYRSTGDL